MSLIGQSLTLSSLFTIFINVVVGQVSARQYEGYIWCFRLIALMTAVSLVLTVTSPKIYS
jgi:hypothetical protein